VVADPAADVAAEREIGHPVVLKLLSPQVPHKSDIGGVALDLGDDAAVQQAATDILRRAAALELIVGS